MYENQWVQHASRELYILVVICFQFFFYNCKFDEFVFLKNDHRFKSEGFAITLRPYQILQYRGYQYNSKLRISI